MSTEQPRRLPDDQAVRDRFLTELDRNAVVEAGAGTGKTTLVVDRIVAQVSGGRVPDGQGRSIEGPERGLVPITDVVAITFTELAAAELSDRLRDRLAQAAASARATGDAALTEHLDRALLELGGAAISTIHSFSSRILKEHALDAGLDPAFEVLDAVGSRRLVQEVFDVWFEEVGRRDEVRRALSHGVSLEDIEQCAREVMDLGPAVLEADEPSAGEGLRDGAAATFMEELQVWVGERVDWRGDELVLPTDQYAGILDLAERMLSSHVSILNGDATDEDYEALELELMLARWRNPTKGLGRLANKQWEDAVVPVGGPDKETFKQRKEDFTEGILDLRARIAARVLAGLHPVLLEFRQRYQEEKDRRSVLDFEDLLAKAEELVRTDPGVRAKLLARYRTLFVDEFQDTNPVQARLVFFLAGGLDSISDTDWLEVAPAPGRLVLVGDPKQSIYRFRHADVEIYRRCCAMVLNADPEAGFSITTNFRTDGSLVDWVNGRFLEGPAVMQVPKDGDYQADFEALVAYHAERGAEAPVLVLRQDEADRALGAEANRPAEARAVARFLRATFVDPEYGPRAASLAPGGEQLELGGVAVLARTDRELRQYAAALAAEGLPYVREGGGKLFDREEVRTALLVLRAVAEPGREVAVVGALRSLWFALADDELLAHRQVGGSFDPLAPGSSGGRVDVALARLGAWALDVAVAPERVLSEVLREPEVLHLLTLRPGGVQAPMNLLRLETFLLEQLAAVGLAGAVRLAAELADGSSDEKGARLALAGAVRLLTIHGSKGLEFPLVVLAGLGLQGKHDGDSGPWLRDGELVWRLGADLSTPAFDECRKWSVPRDAAERLRHFYVALTRAKHHLLLPVFGAADRRESSLAGVFGKGAFGKLLGADFVEPDADAAVLELAHGSPRESLEPAGLAESLAPHLAVDAPAAAAPGRLAEELEARRPAELEPLAPSRLAEELDGHGDQGDGGIPGAEAVDGALARDIGTLTHLCLELGLDPGAARVRAEAEGLPAAEVDFVAGCVLAAEGLGSTERARTARRVHDEPPVLWRVAGGPTRQMRGYIDRLIELEDGSVEVLDYKTDRVDPGDREALLARAAHHRVQLGLYGLALEAAGLKVACLTVAFLAAGEEVCFDFDEAVRDEVRAAIAPGP